MAAGTIRRHQRATGVRYEAVVDLGPDPVTGKRRQRSKSFGTRREAQAALRTWQSEIERGTAVDRSARTVAMLAERWLETKRHTVRPQTMHFYSALVTRYILPALGGVAVQKVTHDQIQDLYAALIARGLSHRTVHHCHVVLKRMMSQAVTWDMVSRNVVAQAVPPRPLAHEMRVWDAVQARAFLAVADQSYYGPIWVLALDTGMRRGELIGLRWREVDLERGRLTVALTVSQISGRFTMGPPKTTSSRRTIALHPDVVTRLRAHRAVQAARRLRAGAAWVETDAVFTATNGNWIGSTPLRRDFLHLCARAGVPPIRIHDLRHTYVTLAGRLGVDLKTLSHRVGHARTSLTIDLYTHLMADAAADTLRVGDALFAAPEDLPAQQAAATSPRHRDPMTGNDATARDPR